jgi:hypothetical protein
MLTLNNNGQIHGLAGVYVKEAKIISVKDLSGKPTYNDDPKSIRDLAIEVEFDVGQDWMKKVIFKGNLKGDNGNQGWGSAFVVKEFFLQTDCFEDLTEVEIETKLGQFAKKEIPVDFLLKVRNKSVIILDYIRGISEEGKPRYYTWNVVKKDGQELVEMFKLSLAKGYPSNYKPELVTNPEKTEVKFEAGLRKGVIESENSTDFDF